MLCSLGVFNAPLMNDAIFKFKRYEDASLTYTGIDKHTNDEVDGWDTTIRKTQYEKLFYNQQSSMSEVDYSAYSRVAEPTESIHKAAKLVDSKPTEKVSQVKPIVQPQPVKQTTIAAPPPESQTMKDLETKLETIGIDSTVIHKKFGRGTVVKINKNEKFIHIKFTLGEKNVYIIIKAAIPEIINEKSKTLNTSAILSIILFNVVFIYAKFLLIS